MAWFVVRDAFGEVLEATPCSDLPTAQERRIALAVRAWKDRGDTAHRLGDLSYRMTSFDGNVRVLSIESAMPALAGDGADKLAGPDPQEHRPR
jgi:hypothetical protein